MTSNKIVIISQIGEEVGHRNLESVRAELDAAEPPRDHDQHVLDVEDVEQVQHPAACRRCLRQMLKQN